MDQRPKSKAQNLIVLEEIRKIPPWFQGWQSLLGPDIKFHVIRERN